MWLELSLRQLTVYNTPLHQDVAFGYSSSVEVLDVRNSSLKEIDFTIFPNVTEVTLKNCSKLRLAVVEKGNLITSLEINNAILLSGASLEVLENLVELTLVNVPLLALPETHLRKLKTLFLKNTQPVDLLKFSLVNIEIMSIGSTSIISLSSCNFPSLLTFKVTNSKFPQLGPACLLPNLK